MGDPLDRAPDAVIRDVLAGNVSAEAAHGIYGVPASAVYADGRAPDLTEIEETRAAMRRERIGGARVDAKPPAQAVCVGALGDSLRLLKNQAGVHVVTPAGHILCSNSTRWRAGAVASTCTEAPPLHRITLHEGLAITRFFCPVSGTLLAVDVHERDKVPVDDVVLDMDGPTWN